METMICPNDRGFPFKVSSYSQRNSVLFPVKPVFRGIVGDRHD